MAIKIGDAVLDSVPMNPIKSSSKDAKHFGARPKRIYQWWCDTKQGFPLPRPHSIYVDADLIPTNQLKVDYTLSGRNGPQATREAYKDLLTAARLPNVNAIQAELNRRFPPVRVPIPYDKLIDPNAEAESRDLFALQIYIRFHLGLTPRNPPFGQFPYPFVLQIPLGVQFHAQVTSTCEDEALDVNFGFLHTHNVLLPRSSEARELLREYNKEMRNRRKLLEGKKKKSRIKTVGPDDE